MSCYISYKDSVMKLMHFFKLYVWKGNWNNSLLKV